MFTCHSREAVQTAGYCSSRARNVAVLADNRLALNSVQYTLTYKMFVFTV